MSAQKAATGVGLSALTVLLLSVGAPALLPPEPVPTVQIESPTDAPTRELPPTAGVPPSRLDPPAYDDEDDSPDDSPEDSPDDSPDDSPEDSPDDD